MVQIAEPWMFRFSVDLLQLIWILNSRATHAARMLA